MNNDKFERLKQKKAEIQALRKQMQEESNKIFGELTKEFFDENPKLESFAWTQYTPYFNDGDTCEFQANTDYIYVNGEYIEDCDWYDKNNITNYGRWNSALKLYEGRVEVENPDRFIGDAMFVILGPSNLSVRNIHFNGQGEHGKRKINGFEFRKLDSKDGRVILDQLYSQSDTTLWVNQYNYTLFEKNNSFFSNGNIVVGGSIQKAGKGTLRLNCFGGQFAGAQVHNGARMVVKDCWFEGNIRNPVYLDGDGEFMMDGAMITPYHVDSTESIVIKDFKGKVTFANMYMQGNFKISPETTADILIWNVNIRGVPVVLPPVGRAFKGKLAVMGITSECNYPGDTRCEGFKSYEDLFFNIPDKNSFLQSNMQIGLSAQPCGGLLPGKSNQVLISRITLERLGVGLKFTQ